MKTEYNDNPGSQNDDSAGEDYSFLHHLVAQTQEEEFEAIKQAEAALD